MRRAAYLVSPSPSQDDDHHRRLTTPAPARRHQPGLIRRSLTDPTRQPDLEASRSAVDGPLEVLAALVADGTLSDGEIRDQVVTLVGAGRDTASASLSWMF